MTNCKKNVMLIANYWHFEEEKASSRYRTMAGILSRAGYNLEIVTSSFRHLTKKQRNLDDINTENLGFKVTMLYEPNYKKNISLRRIYSHHILAKNIVKYLKTVPPADAIIVSVPSLSVGSAVTKYANKNNTPVIIDVQDLWPEAFKMALNVPVVSDILFAPMMIQANNIYKRADKIMAVSQTYVDRALRVSKKCTSGSCIFIGSDPELANAQMQNVSVSKPLNQFWIGYVGALGHSYDIKIVIDAISELNKRGINDIVFKIMGDGPLKSEFEKYAREANVNCDFLGFVDYGTMMATLSKCDIAVNPIIGSSVSSIINKVSDYAVAGIPVVNTQTSPEYRALLEKYGAGINADNKSVLSVCEAVEKIYSAPDLAAQMKENAKKMGEELFDRNRTYPEVIDILNQI